MSSMQHMQDHRAALIAQCPPAPAPLSAADAATRPIHVKRLGATGPAVLFIHGGVQGGLGGGATTFVRQEALAEQGWQLRLADRPGFGQSPSRGVDDMMADAPWIADLLGDGAHLVGHSWGGAEALLAAARRPEAVRSLILVEPAMQPLLMTDPTALNDATKADAGRLGAALMAAQSPREYGLAFARSLGTFDTGGRGPNPIAALEADPEKATSAGCALLQGRMASPDLMKRAAEAVARAHIPVLVITGGWSPTFDAGGDLAAQLTGGRHVIVRSPNHFPQLANATEFNITVDAFMREADRARPAGTK